MQKIYSLAVVLTLSLSCMMAKAQLTCPGYTNYNLNGWTVLVETAAISNHPAEVPVIISHLDKALQNICGYNLAPAILDTLKNIPIFMDWTLDSGAAVYHPNLQWLIDNGYPVQKFRSVNITNMMHFYNWTRKNNPGMIIHEMSHGYYFRKYWGTSVITDIANAYSRVVSSGIYNSVLHIVDSATNNFASHYALTNKEEFFAEMSEAFISGYNDFFPFDKTDLQSYDPDTYDLLDSIWSFDTAVVYPSHSNISRSGWSVWVDSEEGGALAAGSAIDGDPATRWHTHWSGGIQPPNPHRYEIDLGASYTVSGLKYLPTQPPASENGRIKYYVIFVSDDGIEWGYPVASGTWTNDAAEKTVRFLPVTARYIKLTSRSEVHGYPYASAAEINVMGTSAFPLKAAHSGIQYENVPAAENLFTLQNYPNPFLQKTTIEVNIPSASKLTLRITDGQGKLVKIIANNKYCKAGKYRFSWNGKTENGQRNAGLFLLTGSYIRDNAHILIKTVKLIIK